MTHETDGTYEVVAGGDDDGAAARPGAIVDRLLNGAVFYEAVSWGDLRRVDAAEDLGDGSPRIWRGRRGDRDEEGYGEGAPHPALRATLSPRAGRGAGN